MTMNDHDEHEHSALLRLEDTVQELAVNGNMSQGVRRELQRSLQEVEDIRPQLPTAQDLERAGLTAKAADHAGVFWLEWFLEQDLTRTELHALLAKLVKRTGKPYDLPF